MANSIVTLSTAGDFIQTVEERSVNGPITMESMQRFWNHLRRDK